MQKYTITEFNKQFPDDAACLEWLRNYLHPSGIVCKACNKITKHHRIASRQSYSCDECGHHVHPMTGTIFEKTSTSLKLWFYVVYLMASTRSGISAKQIQRETGVTYKTAWRMCKQVRSMLNEDGSDLGGKVEIDETYIGGKRKGLRGRAALGKTIVIGAVERKGRVKATKAQNVKSSTTIPFAQQHILPSTIIYTDELGSYNKLSSVGYKHKRVHHASRVYVTGNGDIHTNTIEGFWSILKRGISGVYHSVSEKHLQMYLNEYSFRYNHRNDEAPMFTFFLHQVSESFD